MRVAVHIEKFQGAASGILTSLTSIATRGALAACILAAALAQGGGVVLIGVCGLGAMAVCTWRRARRQRQLARQEIAVETGLTEQILSAFGSPQDIRNYELTDSMGQSLRQGVVAIARRRAASARIRAGADWAIQTCGVLSFGALYGLGLPLGIDPAGAVAVFLALMLAAEPLSVIFREAAHWQFRWNRLQGLAERLAGSDASQSSATEQRPAPPLESLSLEQVSLEGYLASRLAGLDQSARRKRIAKRKKVEKPFPEDFLEELTLTVQRGEIVGVVAGSPQLTAAVAELALGLRPPHRGRVLYNQEDRRTLESRSCWRQINAMVQEPAFVRGTVREELALACPHALDHEIEAALVEADILEQTSEIAALASSLRQRVQWAQLWLRPSRLDVLVEPVSQNGQQHVERFAQSLQARRAQRAILLLTRDPRLLQICDRVVRIEQDHVTEHGRPVAAGPQIDLNADQDRLLLERGGAA